MGTDLVLTMMEDARTTNRWFIVVVMGRKAGHLALGIGKAAGATLTIIPEEFPGKHVSLDEVCAVIEGSVLKRRLNGRPDGLVVVAEGVGEKLDPDELSRMAGVEVAYDPYGHISLADIPLAHLLKQGVQKRFAERKDRISLVEVTLGYELRCSRPIPFDIDYTRTLGYGAVRFLTTDASDGRLGNGGFVCLEGSRLEVLPFDDLRDPVTGRTRVRLVDVNAEHYTVARDYMIRLERDDLEDQRQLQRLADVAKVTPQEFKRAFAGVLKTEERAHVTA